jgi:hypothetical protein
MIKYRRTFGLDALHKVRCQLRRTRAAGDGYDMMPTYKNFIGADVLLLLLLLLLPAATIGSAEARRPVQVQVQVHNGFSKVLGRCADKLS